MTKLGKINFSENPFVKYLLVDCSAKKKYCYHNVIRISLLTEQQSYEYRQVAITLTFELFKQTCFEWTVNITNSFARNRLYRLRIELYVKYNM